MTHHDHGHAIDLRGECGAGIDDDECHIRGHVSDEAAAAARTTWWEEHHDWDEPEPAWGPWRHRYGRWSMEAGCDGPAQVLRIYDEPGRGRFAVTWCEQQPEIDARAARQALKVRTMEAARARWPSAGVEYYGGQSVRLSLPGLGRHYVRWDVDDPEYVMCARIMQPGLYAYEAARMGADLGRLLDTRTWRRMHRLLREAPKTWPASDDPEVGAGVGHFRQLAAMLAAHDAMTALKAIDELVARERYGTEGQQRAYRLRVLVWALVRQAGEATP